MDDSSGTTADLVRELRAIESQGRTCTLEIRAEGIRTFLYVAKGRLVFAEEGTLGETLGRLMLQRGLLTGEQYAAVIERMTQRIIANEQMRLGEVVVEMGFMTPAQVLDMLGEQVRRKIARCFVWEQSEWSIDEGDDVLEGVGRFPSSLEPLVLLATRTLFEPARLEAVLSPTAAQYGRLRRATDDVAARFAIAGKSLRTITRMDGATRSASLTSAAADTDARAVLAALIVCDEVEWRSEPWAVKSPSPGVRAPAKDPAEILALAAAQRFRPRAAAPVKPVGTFVAPRTQPADVEPLRASTPPRQSTEQRAQRLSAEQHFQRGKRLLRAGDLVRASAELLAAREQMPEASEYALYAAWIAYRTATDAERPDRERAVKLAAGTALRGDPSIAFAHYVMGSVKLAEGDDDQAEKFFKRAIKHDPTERDAERQVRLIAIRRKK